MIGAFRHRLPGPMAAAALAAALACACAPAGGDGPRQSRGTDASGVAYVADADCATCHRTEFDAWTGSHHDLAMQVATPETVLGDFDDATFTHHGVTSRFFRRGDRFFVNTEGPAGAPADFELTHTLGVEPLQQYLAPFPGGRLQSLPIAWDTARNAWFHLYPDERIEPDDPLHWTGRYQTWNLQCAACHSTDLRKGYDIEADTYDTTWAEIDVGCQACHGPGERHVALARDAAGGEVQAGGGEARRAAARSRRAAARSRRAAARSRRAAARSRRAAPEARRRPVGGASSRRSRPTTPPRSSRPALPATRAASSSPRWPRTAAPFSTTSCRRGWPTASTTRMARSWTRSTSTVPSSRAGCTWPACAAPTATMRTA